MMHTLQYTSYATLAFFVLAQKHVASFITTDEQLQ